MDRGFGKFKKLPLETRLNIWRLLLSSGDRAIYCLNSDGIWDHEVQRPLARFPPVMHVCRESRHETLRKSDRPHAEVDHTIMPLYRGGTHIDDVYVLSLADDIIVSICHPDGAHDVMCQWSRGTSQQDETIWVPDPFDVEAQPQQFDPQRVGDIQRLALWSYASPPAKWWVQDEPWFERFPNLRELIIIDSPHPRWTSRSTAAGFARYLEDTVRHGAIGYFEAESALQVYESFLPEVRAVSRRLTHGRQTLVRIALEEDVEMYRRPTGLAPVKNIRIKLRLMRLSPDRRYLETMYHPTTNQACVMDMDFELPREMELEP